MNTTDKKENQKKSSRIYQRKNGKIYNLGLSLKTNIIYNLSIFIACIVIGYKTNDILISLITGVVIYFWSFGIHYIAHKVPYKFNPHMIHHTKDVSHKWWAILIESIINIFGSGGLTLAMINIFIERSFKIRLLNNYVLLYTTLLYTTFHIINYHILKVSTHIDHHKYDTSNYGPDIMDILFNTKVDGGEIEDMNHATINSVFILILILFIMDSKYDLIKFLKEYI